MINNTDQENIILNASISKFNNIFPTYISEKNPKFLEIDDKYIGGLIVYNYSNKFSDIIFKKILDSNLNININIFIEKKDKYKAIKELTEGIIEGKKFQTLLGATGTGKTYTIANVIKNVDRPVLVLAHNKTLAGQLYSEFKEFFPDNRVEYFVSYYDYYQPEAYIAHSDTYIEKDASINDEIDKLRHSATSALFETRNIIIIASVSCIYGLR